MSTDGVELGKNGLGWNKWERVGTARERWKEGSGKRGRVDQVGEILSKIKICLWLGEGGGRLEEVGIVEENWKGLRLLGELGNNGRERLE